MIASTSRLGLFQKLVFHSLAACCVVALVGCSGLVNVSGTVPVDGQPADGVNLRFFPEGDNPEAIPSSATSGDGGKFSMTTNMESGLPKGKYKVSADWPDPNYKPPNQGGLSFGDPEPAPDLLKGRYRGNGRLDAEITGPVSDLKFELLTK